MNKYTFKPELASTSPNYPQNVLIRATNFFFNKYQSGFVELKDKLVQLDDTLRYSDYDDLGFNFYYSRLAFSLTFSNNALNNSVCHVEFIDGKLVVETTYPFTVAAQLDLARLIGDLQYVPPSRNQDPAGHMVDAFLYNMRFVTHGGGRHSIIITDVATNTNSTTITGES